jgi:hypothetical protein
MSALPSNPAMALASQSNVATIFHTMNRSNQFPTVVMKVMKKVVMDAAVGKPMEDIEMFFFSINTGFVFIEWYENKYFTSGSSHE